MAGEPRRRRRGHELSRPDRPPFTRLAGSARLANGSRMTWTVADGRRGRRWRAATTSEDGRLEHALLLEVAPDGRLSRLELASPDGLLTLHPAAGDDSLLGNVVRRDGVEHLDLPWSDRCILLVGVSPIPAVVAAAALASRVGVGEGGSVAGVEVGPALDARAATWGFERVGERRWRLQASDRGGLLIVEHDDAGVPIGLQASASWPLELHGPG